MHVTSVSRTTLGAAVLIGAATVFSPSSGAAAVAVAVGLIALPLAFLRVARLLPRPTRLEAAASAIASTGDARFAPPQADSFDTRPDPAAEVALELALASVLVGATACWRLATQVSFESLVSPLVAGVIGGALLTACGLKLGLCDRRSVSSAFAGFALVAAAAFGWLDVVADSGSPVRAQVAVTGRDAARPERLARHALELGVGATRTDWHRVVVSADDRRHVFPGSTACLEEHEGALGLRWAAVHACAADAALTGEVAARRWIEHYQRPLDEFPESTRRVLAGQWQDVDRELSDLQRRFAAGQATDLEIDQAFDAFYIASPLLDAPLRDWLAAAPRSPAALVAAAQHARAQSDVLSAGGFDAEVSRGLNAEDQHAIALRHLDAADALLPKPSSLHVLLRYRMTAGTRATSEIWLDRALAANPDDLLMRREYLTWHRLCPCRNGVPDDPAMRRVLATPAPPQVKEALAAERLYERAVDIDGSEPAAALYRQVLASHAHPQELYTANINLGVYLAEHGDKPGALARLDAAIAILPGNVHAHAVRGWLHEEMGHHPQAIADDLVDARHRDLGAQHAAGRILLWGKPGVPADLREAARWIAEASYLGESEARGLIRSRADLLAQVGQQPVRALSAAPASPAAPASEVAGRAGEGVDLSATAAGDRTSPGAGLTRAAGG